MNLLAIHSNKLLLKSDSPNAYQFLAEKRNKLKEYEILSQQHAAGKHKGPLLLQDMFALVAQGLDQTEFEKRCLECWQTYQAKDIEERLKKIKEKFDLIYIFTSYPQALYDSLVQNNIVSEVFGVEPLIQDKTIQGIKKVSLKNEADVKNKLIEIDMADNFTLEPNRYGLLEILIDIMIEKNISDEQVTVVGKDLTALPLHKVSRRQVENFDELEN